MATESPSIYICAIIQRKSRFAISAALWHTVFRKIHLRRGASRRRSCFRFTCAGCWTRVGIRNWKQLHCRLLGKVQPVDVAKRPGVVVFRARRGLVRIQNATTSMDCTFPQFLGNRIWNHSPRAFSQAFPVCRRAAKNVPKTSRHSWARIPPTRAGRLAKGSI